jgi:tRNA 2-thiouridine synthesizing protein A
MPDRIAGQDPGVRAARWWLRTTDEEAAVDAMTATVLDFTGLPDSLPLAWTAVAMARLRSGNLVEVRISDPGLARDFSAWCRATGNPLLGLTSDDGVLRLIIKKR